MYCRSIEFSTKYLNVHVLEYIVFFFFGPGEIILETFLWMGV